MNGVDVSSIDDALFAREKETTEDADRLNYSVARPTVTSPERKALQTKVDAALLKNVKAVDKLEAYLGAMFTLSNGDKPHLLKF